MKNQVLHIGFMLMSILIFSCENKKVHQAKSFEDKSYTLRVNFKENLLDLNPYNATTASETFVRDVCYENIFKTKNKGLESRVFEQWSYDSIEYVLNFKLSAHIFFQNGAKMSSQDVKTAFLSVLKNAHQSTSIPPFFESIVGWPMIEWLKTNRNVLDSLPRGIRFKDDQNFQIQFIRHQKSVDKIFRDFPLYIVREESNQFIGTGPFKVEVLDSDIFCDLTRNQYFPNEASNIDHINIRFIKDHDTELREFESGSLDIIFPDAVKIKDHKYANYTHFTTNHAILKFASWSNTLSTLEIDQFRNLNNSTLILDRIEGQFNYSSWAAYLAKSTNDSLLFDSTRLDYGMSLNPKISNLVIEERYINYFQENDSRKIITDLAIDLNLQPLNKLMILDSKPKVMLANNSLKGMASDQNLSAVINKLYFVTPSTY